MITNSFLMTSIEVLNQYHPRLDTIMDILAVSLLWDRLTVWQSPSISGLHDTHTHYSAYFPNDKYRM